MLFSDKKIFNNVDLFAVKILDSNARGDLALLIESLKYICNTDIKLINLSLSVVSNNELDELLEICNTLSREGKIIVCSLENGVNESYLACYENVIGVKGVHFRR